jgi:hypothetical protein
MHRRQRTPRRTNAELYPVTSTAHESVVIALPQAVRAFRLDRHRGS